MSAAESLCVGQSETHAGYEIWVRRRFDPHGYDAVARLLVRYGWQTNLNERVRVMRNLIKLSRQIGALPRYLGIVRQWRP